jgi:hypothetical protein
VWRIRIIWRLGLAAGAGPRRGPVFAAIATMKTELPVCPRHLLEESFYLDGEVDRIRAVFALPEDAPLPKVGIDTLSIYHEYLLAHLSFPFQALYTEGKRPTWHRVRYLTVGGLLLDLEKQPLKGITCRVEGFRSGREPALVEMGVREDDPNYRIIDDYAYWFLNYR